MFQISPLPAANFSHLFGLSRMGTSTPEASSRVALARAIGSPAASASAMRGRVSGRCC